MCMIALRLIYQSFNSYETHLCSGLLVEGYLKYKYLFKGFLMGGTSFL